MHRSAARRGRRAERDCRKLGALRALRARGRALSCAAERQTPVCGLAGCPRSARARLRAWREVRGKCGGVHPAASREAHQMAAGGQLPARWTEEASATDVRAVRV